VARAPLSAPTTAPQARAQNRHPRNCAPAGRSAKSRARPVAVVHRLALYDDSEAIVNIISQTDIVRWVGAATPAFDRV
jgi:hypothetical protein